MKLLVIVSNRLPVKLVRSENEKWQTEPASGGLVTAMTPVLKRHGGLWIGWPGTEGVTRDEIKPALDDLGDRVGYELEPVSLGQAELENYYLGFSNEVLWPLFHDLQSRANFEERYWTSYREVNRKFAEVIASRCGSDDVIWVHDYHLMSVASELRDLGVKSRSEFFLHTPFPSVDIFSKLPWRAEILRGLLMFDAVGFQTARDLGNYLQCVRHFVPDARIEGSDRIQRVTLDNRKAHVGSFPISIDFEYFNETAQSEETIEEADRLREKFGDRKIILGADRLDYTKGIPHRLRAFRRALERFKELRGNVILVQVVVPSRDEIPEYAALKNEIEQLVGEINGEFSRAGWIPVHYIFRGLPQEDLIALYRAADIMLVTPLKDGMNLVSKEFCAAHPDDGGVLILSEFAGSVAQLGRDAIVVNPYDVEGVSSAIREATRLEKRAREQRMRSLRATVEQEDIFWWLESFMGAVSAYEGETERSD